MMKAKKFQAKKHNLSSYTSQSERKTECKKAPLIVDKKIIPQTVNNLNQEKKEIEFCDPSKTTGKKLAIPGKRVLDRNTFKRLKDKAVVVTAEERREAIQLQIANKEKLKKEYEARIKELQNYDLLRTKGPKLAQLDNEASKKTNYLLARAYQLRQNQEDEIKKCDSLVLGTKCLAIRCAQIAEKELIQKEMKQEERRMEKFMEQQRMLAAKKFEKAMEAERIKKKIQATDIVQQMKENEVAKELEAAKNAEDARIRTEAAIEAQREEVKDYKEKLLKQAVMRKEFLQLNAQLSDIKKIEKELANIEVLQIQEYNKKKNEREMAFEEEVKKQKLLKEKEIAKIQASQKASQDLQAAKDELNALRVQDKVEREWRRKEKEEAIRKIKVDEDLKEARRKQIENQRENYAFEIQREKEEFDKIVKLNVEDIEKTKESEKQTRLEIDEHRKNLLKQIHEKELEKIQERKMFFQEGIKYQQEEAARRKALRDTMEKKIEELKKHNLPTKYIHGIERQLKLK